MANDCKTTGYRRHTFTDSGKCIRCSAIRGERKMTKREALRVLMKHAAANCMGVGCGIRTSPSREERTRVEAAIRKVYREAEGYEADESVLFNFGLR